MLHSDARRGGVLSALLITVLAIILLVAIGGVFVARNVHLVANHGNTTKDVSIELPGGGHFSLQARENLTPSALGIPAYPGSTRNRNSGGASFEWTSGDGKEDKRFAVAGTDLLTSDSPDRVLDWYREQLPNWILTTDHDGSMHLELKKGGYRRIVVISAKSDGTHIGVASIGEPASN